MNISTAMGRVMSKKVGVFMGELINERERMI